MFRFDVVIWDWNGTLLDDLWLALETANGMLRRRGLAEMDADRYREIFDFPVEHYYRRAGFDFSVEPFSVLAQEFITGFNSRIHECRLHPRAEEVVETLQRSSVSQLVLSASRESTLHTAVMQRGLSQFFDALHGLQDDLAVSKAHVGKELITRHRLDPDRTVLIGDTVHDAEVAQDMGVACILVAGGHHSRQRLEATGVPVYTALEEVLSASHPAQ
ncbi:MAG TPA: HAD family hydrolase [Alkalispirochaeta sp.]|nr:HAD family hydrolase [Alkalispirochaeta sp.]